MDKETKIKLLKIIGVLSVIAVIVIIIYFFTSKKTVPDSLCNPICPINKICNNEKECVCDSTHTSSTPENNCETKKCNINSDCSTTMECNTGSCKCKSGYYGESCNIENPMCFPAGTSSVNTDKTCECKNDWTGTKCDKTTIDACASNICKNSSTCVNNNGVFRCICNPYYTGPSCNLRSAKCKDTCNDHGECDKGECTCDKDWTGAKCETNFNTKKKTNTGYYLKNTGTNEFLTSYDAILDTGVTRTVFGELATASMELVFFVEVDTNNQEKNNIYPATKYYLACTYKDTTRYLRSSDSGICILDSTNHDYEYNISFKIKLGDGNSLTLIPSNILEIFIINSSGFLCLKNKTVKDTPIIFTATNMSEGSCNIM